MKLPQYLSKPNALLFEKRCRNNIKRLKSIAEKAGVDFRPHFKTHQSAETGRWFLEEGITKITVTSVGMASYFAENGWTDITIAFPFFKGQTDQINRFAKNCKLTVFLADAESAKYLKENLKYPVQYKIEIDAGYNRSGIPFRDSDTINSVINTAGRSGKLNFAGFYAHDGATYQADSKPAVADIANRNFEAFSHLKEMYPGAHCSMGDTPSCSILTDFGPVDEITPGNFVFYDLMQLQIGSCSIEDIALFVEAPVAQIKKHTDQIIIHAGAAHLSKDFIMDDGNKVFGQMVYFDQSGRTFLIDGAYLSSLSQEHGVVEGAEKVLPYISDRGSVYICPVHSCLTANLFEYYTTPEGKTITKRILS